MTTPLPSVSAAAVGASRVDTLHPVYLPMRSRWQMCRDVKGGTEILRAKKETYLPRFEAEDAEDWEARVKMTYAYDALAQTVSAVVGLAFRQPPVLGEDVPALLREWWENLDGEGTHGNVLAERALEDAITDGHAGFLVDAPQAPDGLSARDEAEMGIRPYALLYSIDQIRNWRVEVVNGRRVLTLLVLAESLSVPSGDFGVAEVSRWRVYRQRWREEVRDPRTGSILRAVGPYVGYEVWEATGTSKASMVAEGTVGTVNPDTGEVTGGTTFIPFFPVYGGEEVDILLSTPPLHGLAYSNVDHTQVKSDRRYSMHKCAIPVPVFIGRSMAALPEAGAAHESVTMSPSRGIDVMMGGDAKYLEPTGAALQALREELQDIEKRMASQGLSILQRDTAQAETATAFAMQRAREESKLSRAVRSLQDALEGVLGALAAFGGFPEGGSVTLSRDFSALGLGTGEIQVLSNLVERGQLSLARLLEALVKGGVLPDDMDVDEEVEAVKRDTALAEPALPPGQDLAAALGLGPEGPLREAPPPPTPPTPPGV